MEASTLSSDNMTSSYSDDIIPFEIWAEIFDYLDLHHTKCLALTCLDLLQLGLRRILSNLQSTAISKFLASTAKDIPSEVKETTKIFAERLLEKIMFDPLVIAKLKLSKETDTYISLVPEDRKVIHFKWDRITITIRKKIISLTWYIGNPNGFTESTWNCSLKKLQCVVDTALSYTVLSNDVLMNTSFTDIDTALSYTVLSNEVLMNT